MLRSSGIIFLTLLLFSLYKGYEQLTSKSRIFTEFDLSINVSNIKNPVITNELVKLASGQWTDILNPYVPVLWWHHDEKFPAIDAAEIFEKSNLVYRTQEENYIFNKNEAVLGPISSFHIAELIHNGASPVTPVTRLFELGGIKQGREGFELHFPMGHYYRTLNTPMYWRLSQHPVYGKIQSQDPDEIIIPIEFWYFSLFNETGVLIADHEGDWESFLILVKLHIDHGKEFVKPLMILTSAHMNSSWHCYGELSQNSANQYEVFSAVGMHATYTNEGWHSKGVMPDRTSRGTLWTVSKDLQPLVLQKFYGFSGGWGASTFSQFQSGPLAPGPLFKHLPVQVNLEEAYQELMLANKKCGANEKI